MISSKRHEFLGGLLVLLVSVTAFSQEPNEAESTLKFQISDEKQEWLLMEGKVVGEWRIKPTHVGELFIPNLARAGYSARDPKGRSVMKYQPDTDFSSNAVLKEILETSAGRSMSRHQREFVRTGYAITTIGGFGETIGNHFRFRCYAVTQEDVQKIVKALIEFLTDAANARLELCFNNRKTDEKRITEYQDNIAEKEAELKAVEAKLAELGKTVHYLSPDEAEQTVVELNKSLNTLDVEIAGLQAKVGTIEKYRSDKMIRMDNTARTIGTDALARLEAMLSEETVELAGALAKKETTTKIRNAAEEFYNLHQQQVELPKSLSGFKGRLSIAKRSLVRIEETLFNLPPEMLPPKVYQDKVTIYPVRVDE